MRGGVCGSADRSSGRCGGSRRRRSLSRSLPVLRQNFPEYAATRQCDADQPKDNDTAWRSAAGPPRRWLGRGGGGGGEKLTHTRSRKRLTKKLLNCALLRNRMPGFFLGYPSQNIF